LTVTFLPIIIYLFLNKLILHSGQGHQNTNVRVVLFFQYLKYCYVTGSRSSESQGHLFIRTLKGLGRRGILCEHEKKSDKELKMLYLMWV